jgi:hypothetical protein
MLAVLVLGAFADVACVISTTAQHNDEVARRAFLDTVDDALNSREAQKIAALVDLQQWRATGRDELPAATLWLPPAPLKRVRDLSVNEVLYEDGEGDTWRLRMRKPDDQGKWLITAVPRPCPPKSMPRGPVGRELPAPPRASDVTTPSASALWTPLECWPLPR